MAFRSKGTVGPTVIVSMEPDRSGNYVCDGTADDVQIQAAIDYVETLGGGSVYVKQGTYDISAGLTIYAGGNTDVEGLLFEGAGSATILRATNNHAYRVIRVSTPGNAVYNVHFRKFKIYSVCGFGTADGSGIELNFAYNCSLDTIHIGGVGKHGFYVVGSFAKVTALNSKFGGCWGSGARLETASLVDIIGCEIHNNTAFGIDLVSDTIHTKIIGNSITWNVAHGIFSESAGCQHVVISGNSFYHNASTNPNTRDNINITNGSYFDVVGNVFFDDEGTDTARSNIYLDGADKIIVADNNMSKARSDGIYLEDAEDCSITGNIVEASDAFDINISNAGCLRTLVKDNRLLSATKFQDLGTDTAVPWFFAEVADPDGNIGRHPAIVLTDGADIMVRGQIYVPLEFQELVTAQAHIVAGGNGDMRRGVDTDWGKLCTTEDYDAGSDTIAAGEVAVLIDDMTCVDISAALDGIAAGDLVGVEFTRYGSHGNDTVGADCYYLGIRVRYV